jgi:hypothetical protein
MEKLVGQRPGRKVGKGIEQATGARKCYEEMQEEGDLGIEEADGDNPHSEDAHIPYICLSK